MAEFKNNTSADRRYKKAQYDDSPVAVDLVKSIREMRRIYSSMSDAKFVAWYAHRYKIEPNRIRAVVERKPANDSPG